MCMLPCNRKYDSVEFCLRFSLILLFPPHCPRFMCCTESSVVLIVVMVISVSLAGRCVKIVCYTLACWASPLDAMVSSMSPFSLFLVFAMHWCGFVCLTG